jgi:hypothetical protein
MQPRRQSSKDLTRQRGALIEHESAQTFGIVQINPGHHNFLHSHPNSEEIL